MSSLSAKVEGLSVDQLHLLPIDPNVHSEKQYKGLFRAHMQFLMLTAGNALDPNDPDGNDQLLMDILNGLEHVRQHEDVPKHCVFECLDARVKDNYRNLAEN
jgi:hypothetical protein